MFSAALFAPSIRPRCVFSRLCDRLVPVHAGHEETAEISLLRLAQISRRGRMDAGPSDGGPVYAGCLLDELAERIARALAIAATKSGDLCPGERDPYARPRD